jgi:hypothetical protein
MKTNRKIQPVICLAAIVLFASSCLAQQPGALSPETVKISLKGKITYVQRTGYYMVNGESPAEVYFIVNPDAKLLDTFIKAGKTAAIDGHLTFGADQLFIEKINGKQYSPAKQK